MDLVRSTLWASLGSVCLLLLHLTVLSKTQPRKPHIVLIVADDMGYNDVGYNNQHNDVRTPFLDKLAAQGMRLNTYYSQSVCSPSRAALVTGRYPFRYGMQGARPITYGSSFGMATNETTLPQMLKSGGYLTYLVGKWHLGFSQWAMTPVRRGFDYFYGMYGGLAHYFSHLTAEPNGPGAFDMFEDVPSETAEGGVEHKTLLETAGVHSELLFTQKAVSIISEHDVEEDDKPLFLMLTYMNPHSPLEPLESDLRRAGHVQNEIRRNFTALMSSLDYGVEEVVLALKRRRMYDDTVIIFTGDNGGAVVNRRNSESLGGTNYPFRGAKYTVWEGGVRVPSFAVGPGIKAGVVSEELFHITDWYPTLAKLADIDLEEIENPKLDGVDQTDLLLNNGPSARSEAILELDMASRQAAIREGHFKLIVGKAAGTRRLDGIYEPLTGNKTSYTFAEDEWPYSTYGKTFFKRVSIEAQQQFKDYLKEFPCTKVTHSLKLNTPAWTCYNNFAHIGNLTYHEVSLYDLSSDPSESYDLYTEDGRFQSKAETLYNKLVAASEGMVHPKAFGLAGGDLDVTRKTSEDGVTIEWTPFIKDGEGQDYRDFVP